MAIIEPGNFFPDILEAARGVGDLAPVPVPYTGVLTGAPGERMVSLCSVGDRVFVATEFHVYELVDGIWHMMVFATGDEPSGG